MIRRGQPRRVLLPAAQGHRDLCRLGRLQLGVTGADLMDESGGQEQRVLKLGFGASKFRYAADEKRLEARGPRREEDRDVVPAARPRAPGPQADQGRHHQARRRRGDQRPARARRRHRRRRVAGRTLRQHHLKAFGEPIAESQATLIQREPRPDRMDDPEIVSAKRVFVERLRGVVYARQYLMLDYDCPVDVLEKAKKAHARPAGADDRPALRRGLGGGPVDGAAFCGSTA